MLLRSPNLRKHFLLEGQAKPASLSAAAAAAAIGWPTSTQEQLIQHTLIC